MIPEADNSPRSRRRARTGNFIYKVLPLLIIVLAVGGAVWLIKTKPRPKRRPPAERPALVNTEPLVLTAERVVVEATGNVIPARQVSLQARVASEVIEISPDFVPGGRFEAGEIMLRLDPSDYRLALEARKADVERAEAAYKLELGQQDIARHEWSLVEKIGVTNDLDRELTLRQPQLKDAAAVLDAARTLMEQARINLDRTEIRAPFNAILRDRNVNVGSQVSGQTPLAEIVGTDEYWVMVSIPLDRLKWIAFPADGVPGATARLRPPGGVAARGQWKGEVIRRLPDIEEQGRLARVLISVKNPLDSEDARAAETPLLLGAFVHVSIDGAELDKVFRIPARALHDGDTVWLVNSESRLETRQVEVLWRERSSVLARDGIKQGEKMVVSQLGAPVPGMLLREEQRRGSGARQGQDASTGKEALKP